MRTLWLSSSWSLLTFMNCVIAARIRYYLKYMYKRPTEPIQRIRRDINALLYIMVTMLMKTYCVFVWRIQYLACPFSIRVPFKTGLFFYLASWSLVPINLEWNNAFSFYFNSKRSHCQWWYIDIVFSGIAFEQDGPVYYTFATYNSFEKSFGTLAVMRGLMSLKWLKALVYLIVILYPFGISFCTITISGHFLVL